MMRFMSSLRSIQRGTQKVSVPRRRPPLRIVADDTTLTPYGGSAVVGELCRGLGLVEGLDRAIEGVTRARAFKQRRRGASAGELLVAMAESMLVGGDAFNDLEDLRHDEAGAELRAVPEVPAASTAAQLARRLRPSHLRAAEAALAAAGDRLDRELGRDPAEPVTLDFDSTLVEVYGRRKPGASRAHSGQLAYQPLLGVWAERGRVLSAELLSGSDSTRRDDTLALVRRALALLPAGHGHVSARFDGGLLPHRAASDAAPQGGLVHDLGAAQPGDVAGAFRDR
jgi:Transposase DDE domain group 1